MKTIFKVSAIASVAILLTACGGGGGGAPIGDNIIITPPTVRVLPGTGPNAPSSRIDGTISGTINGKSGSVSIVNNSVSGTVGNVTVSGNINSSVSGMTLSAQTGTAQATFSGVLYANGQTERWSDARNFTWRHVASGPAQGIEVTDANGIKVLLPYASRVEMKQTGNFTSIGQNFNASGSISQTSELNTVQNSSQVGYLNARYGNGANPITLGTGVTVIGDNLCWTALNSGTCDSNTSGFIGNATRALNPDVANAWRAGFVGQGINMGFNDANATGISTAFTTVTGSVAPGVGSYTGAFDIVVGTGTFTNTNAGGTLKNNGLYVASASNISQAATAVGTAYAAANTLPVNRNASSSELGVVGSTSADNAAAIGGGYAALVMSKFNGLTGVQAGDILRQTASGQSGSSMGNLNLPAALAPAGRLR